jgi:hypothetical protein
MALYNDRTNGSTPTDAARVKVFALAMMGLTRDEISAEIGRKRTYVDSLLHRINTKPAESNLKDIIKLKRLIYCGYSQREASKILGRSPA